MGMSAFCVEKRESGIVRQRRSILFPEGLRSDRRHFFQWPSYNRIDKSRSVSDLWRLDI